MAMRSFEYDLPPEAIAQTPVEPRDAARLLVATDPAGAVEHRRVADLADLLDDGDLLVVNDTRVLPARLLLRKPTGGEVEVLLLEPAGDNGSWQALVRPSRRLQAGTVLRAGDDLEVEIGDALPDGRRTVRVGTSDLMASLDRHGVIPLPPYIHTGLSDPERYQTVYSAEPGSVAAPTAGLHLTEALLERCRASGAQIATVDLAVGLDTFRPVTTERAEDHHIHSERYSVPLQTLEACREARRVVAVGTTTVRALESAAVGPTEGRTSLFIYGDYPFQVVDVLLTNFHLPRSSLLLLLASFAGERWRDLYQCALAEGYRFLSFGDAMLVGRAA
jgi:S-adenosylmethionine:tRNA ribosyltransferase-isomerase